MAGKTVCIVGAGQSGLVSLKESVLRGLKPTCYELDSDLGGMWRSRNANDTTNTASLWPNFITNTSKWANSFSDFPSNAKDPPFQTQEAQFQYYLQYAKHFKLDQFIKFSTRVIWIRKATDHAISGRWEVFTCPTADFREGDKSASTPQKMMEKEERERFLSECKMETFDFILICTGYFKLPHFPDVPGASDFEGTIHHSFFYTSPKAFENKNVLVVGNKMSAADITDDIGAVTKQAYLAVGDGTWIIPRVYSGGRTFDQLLTRNLLYHWRSSQKLNDMVISTAQNRLDHYALGIAPSQELCSAPIAFADGLAVKIMSGRVKLFGNLTKLSSKEAHFKDGNVIPHLDALIFCTGYDTDLSFLDLNVLSPNGKMELYKMVFPVREEHHTLAFIGILGCDSPMAMVSELQARLATMVMTNLQSLPSQTQMEKDANHWNELNWKSRKSYRYFLPGFVLADSIATSLGVYPSFWKIVLRDPLLAYRLWYGNIVGAQYRLVGQDSQWEEARQFCHQQYEERARCLRQSNGSEL